MTVRRFIVKSLQCFVSFCVLLKAFCSRKGLPTQASSSQEVSNEKDIDNQILEAGDTKSMKSDFLNRDKGARDMSEAELATPRCKGICFFSTSTIAEGDTPVVLPWRAVSDIYDDKASASSTHVHGQSISQDISSCGRRIYDDSSMFGLSFLFDSESDSYEVDDTSCDFLHKDFQEGTLGNDLVLPWVEPVDSKWKTDVATAMDAFRSCRVDHDDIVAFPVHLKGDDLAQQSAGVSKELDDLQHIENWRNDFLAADDENLTSPSNYAAISCFRFP